MPFTRIWSAVAYVVVIACGSEPRGPKPPAVSAAFPSLPLPPSPHFLSKAGSEDALQITLFSSVDAAQVAGYYRDLLGRGGWHLVNEVKNSDESVVLYATHQGRPLWVRIWPTSDRAGTMVELAGAVVASIKDSAPKQGN